MNAKLVSASIAMLAATTLCPTLAAARQAAAPEITVVPNACRWQANTLAQVVGYRLGDEKLFDGVVVFNGAASTLTEVRIGCVLEATLPGETRPTRITTLLTEPTSVEIPNLSLGTVRVPWTTRGIIAILIGLLRDSGATDVTATLGVAGATWADGTRFSKRPSSGFRERPNAALDAAYATVDAAALDAALAAEPAAPAPAAPATLHTCRSVPHWMCAVSIFTGQCVGSAMCPEQWSCSSKCVAVVLPNL
jgi:hypothetical protein